jgi:hypothetical protein
MRQVRHGAASEWRLTPAYASSAGCPRCRSATVVRRAAGATRRGAGGVAGRRCRRSGSGRRGSGRWPTAPVTACCPAAARSRVSMAGTSGGGGWSNAPALLANSMTAASPANRTCAWCRRRRASQSSAMPGWRRSGEHDSRASLRPRPRRGLGTIPAPVPPDKARRPAASAHKRETKIKYPGRATHRPRERGRLASAGPFYVGDLQNGVISELSRSVALRAACGR